MTTAASRDDRDQRTVILNLTPAAARELDRMLAATSLTSPGDVFARGFTLLRICVDATAKGQQVKIIDPNGDKYTITLPFFVEPKKPE